MARPPAGLAARVRSGLAVFRSPGLLARAFGASLALWLADVVMYLVLARAFGLHLSLGGAFLLEGIGNLALAVPATAAGVGTFDFLTLLGTKSVGLAGPGAGSLRARAPSADRAADDRARRRPALVGAPAAHARARRRLGGRLV